MCVTKDWYILTHEHMLASHQALSVSLLCFSIVTASTDNEESECEHL